MMLHLQGEVFINTWNRGFRYISSDGKVFVDVVSVKRSDFFTEFIKECVYGVTFGEPEFKVEETHLQKFTEVAGIQYFTEEEIELCKSNRLVWKKYYKTAPDTRESVTIMVKRICDEEDFNAFKKALTNTWQNRSKIREIVPISYESPWIIDFGNIVGIYSAKLMLSRSLSQTILKNHNEKFDLPGSWIFSRSFEEDITDKDILLYEEYFKKNMYNKPVSPRAERTGVYSECFEWLGEYGQISTYAFPIKYSFNEYQLNVSLKNLGQRLQDSFMGDFFEIPEIPNLKWSEEIESEKLYLVAKCILESEISSEYSESFIKEILEEEIEAQSFEEYHNGTLFEIYFENLSVINKKVSVLMTLKFGNSD